MNRKQFLKILGGIALTTLVGGRIWGKERKSTRPNVMLITADDMNRDSVGVYGCPVAGITPNLDKLASEGMRFEYAHMNSAVCQPCRSTLMTGLYTHRCGGEGFYHLRKPDVPILPALLRKEGYLVGLLGKVEDSTPYADFRWDMVHDHMELGNGRNPAVYYAYTKGFIQRALKDERPFFLMVNSHDPHRPFYGNDGKEWYKTLKPPAVVPSRVYKPEEVNVPGFLPDLPEVRLEMSEYYSSVRRCDDTVGEVLKVLRETGIMNDTLVIFFSDNGMAFPFAKTNCYPYSTRTPWIIRWPGKVKAGLVDRAHLISGIDLMPTILDTAGISSPPKLDGFSFLPLLRGETQQGREMVFTQFHQTFTKRNYPMRSVQTKRFAYIFNPWSDGKRIFENEAQSGRTMEAMKRASQKDKDIAARVDLFLKRVREEFYDLQNDPDALHNLIDNPLYAEHVNSLRGELEKWMQRTQDPALEAFRKRTSREALDAFMQKTAETLGGR